MVRLAAVSARPVVAALKKGPLRASPSAAPRSEVRSPTALDSLARSGAFVAIEALVDAPRRQNVQALLMSLNMLIEFGEAFDYTGADFHGWCSDAGFQKFEVIHLAWPR